MDYSKISAGIEHEGKIRYIAYLRKLENESAKDKASQQYVKKNPWFSKFNEDRYIEIYNEVLATGIYIDGETVTLETRGIELVPNFNYQAYKNLVLSRYPETKFDFQNVYEGDQYSFRKDSGKVTYTHIISDPFTTRTLIGAYGVIKNSTGEFVETLNKEDIGKMRNVAKTDNIWKMWFDEMVKKSIIKRICKVNFRDIVERVEEYDNSNYEPENADFNHVLREEINACTKLNEIMAIYDREKLISKDLNKLSQMCTNRKKEIEVTPDSPEWEEVKAKLQSGVLLPEISKEYYISNANREILTAECL